MNTFQEIRKTLTSCPVLIVDDDQLIRLYIAAFLENAGFEKIDFAENGAEALEKISKSCPACVILDVEMPVMNGHEVLAKIRGDEETRELPVIVVTGHDERDERNEILRAGASNLISKPIDGDILVERVSNLIERKLLIDQLSEFHNRLSSELANAARMQTDVVPTVTEIHTIEDRYNVRLASQFKPSSELGGDYWSLQAIDDNRFGIMTADFSGHGISAALNTFRLNMLVSRLGVCTSTPAEYLEAINNQLTGVIPIGQFCTMLYALIDLENNTLTYAGAAAPEPVFGPVEGGDINIGDGSGLPLGVRANFAYENHIVDFPADSFLFLFSDALFETECGDSGALEIEGVVALAKEHRHSRAGVALGSILADFFETAPDPLPDDLTAVWLSR